MSALFGPAQTHCRASATNETGILHEPRTRTKYTYDYNGNTQTMVNSSGTTTYAWDFENRLTSVTLPGSGGTVYFKYDPLGRRIYKSSSSATSIYAYDGDNLVEETNSAGAAVARYSQGLNIDEPLVMLRSGTTSYYQADGLGSLTSLTNPSGALASAYTYDSFGNLVASSGSIVNNFRYTGREFDPETSLYYYRARYYDPTTGRFVSNDPVAFAGGQANFYAYIGNHPIDLTDPFGLRPLTDCEKQKLAPYIPKIDLDNANLHDDGVPWYLGKDYEGITRGNDIYFRSGVYDPSTVGGLAILGHELVHVGQYRNGMTWLKYLWASRHGYDKNPYEKPAYDKEAEIKQGLKDACGGPSKC